MRSCSWPTTVLDTRELYAMHFTSHGFRALTSIDGQSTIETALAHRPDVIILDVPCRSSTASPSRGY